jgi:hypothetical protein
MLGMEKFDSEEITQSAPMRGSLHRRKDDNGNPIQCIVDGCNRNTFCLRMCRTHYNKHRYATSATYFENKWIECPVDECNRNMLKTSKLHLCKVHYQFAWRYGLTGEQTVLLFRNRRCENPGCGNVKNLHIDHDHSCCSTLPACGNCVRGWLCAGCNKALGLLSDNEEKIKGLLIYLNRG